MPAESNLKIFSLNRIKFDELWADALSYVKKTYKAASKAFTPASPFGQILQVVLHMGRMILYYIEDSITGLNIRTAYRPDQIRGLAQLSGHTPGRPIAARGAIDIVYYDQGDGVSGNICYIPNKTQILSKINGLTYTIMFGADNAKMTMRPGNHINATVIQGKIKIQSATASGYPLQSFNFIEKNYKEIDQYYLNVYVNGEPWETVESLLDLGFNQKGCVVRSGITGGVDIFFGDGSMGMIPEAGATILVEYIVTDGATTNIAKEYANSDNYWEFVGKGYLNDGSEVDLNRYFRLKATTDIIFGTASEDITLTQLIAPNTSRSYVLATELNYKYFFKKMNMFSNIDIIQGTSNRTGLTVLNLAYQQAAVAYQNALSEYNTAVSLYGANDERVALPKEMLQYNKNVLEYTQQRMSDQKYVDNTVYIFLVPDIKKRISANQNYFTCEESVFTLSEDEKNNILNLIDASGQRAITVENRIVDPKLPRFALNVEVKIWEGYSPEDVYAAGLKALSDYFISLERKDMIPISDIVAIFEREVNGIDSVKAWFDADVNNKAIYCEDIDETDYPYGIDRYGDIVLTRRVIDSSGNPKTVRDIIPLIRGGFNSMPHNGTSFHYDNFQQYNQASTRCGFTFYASESKSKNMKVTLDTYTQDGK